MKKIEKFECGYCHELFDSEEECKTCESHHHMPKRMVSVSFSGKTPMNESYDAPYPLSIIIRMDDDKEIAYSIDPAEKKTKRDKKLDDALGSVGDVFDQIFKNKR